MQREAPIATCLLLATIATVALVPIAKASDGPKPNDSAMPEPLRQPLTVQTQAMQQRATVYVPTTAPAASAVRRPAVVVLHPGFAGDEATAASFAAELGRHGVIAVMPAYRGEHRALDGIRSDGSIEFCSGEVNDAQEMLRWLRSRPDVDPLRIGLIGASHGGCIALRTAIREPRIRALALISAPVAAEALRDHLLQHPFGFFLYNGILVEQLQRYVNGPNRIGPNQQPAPAAPGSYAVRSPLFLAGKLTMPVAIIHGSSDSIVPVEQACWLAQVLRARGRRLEEHWLGRDGKPRDPPKKLCGEQPPVASLPEAPQSPRSELWLAEGQDHIFFSRAAKRAAEAIAIQFLLRELQ